MNEPTCCLSDRNRVAKVFNNVEPGYVIHLGCDLGEVHHEHTCATWKEAQVRMREWMITGKVVTPEERTA